MTDQEMAECRAMYSRGLTECLNIAVRSVELYEKYYAEKKDEQSLRQLQAKKKVLREVPRILAPQIASAQTLEQLSKLWPGDVFRAPL